MTGHELVEFAGALSDGTTAVEFRTAIGRAYYGAFHVALELLFDAGVHLPASPEAHQKLRLCLLQSGEPSAAQSGEWLESLRKQRNQADYNLAMRAPETKHNAQVQVQRAREIVAALAACGQEPARSRFRARVRHYAESVLRLIVSN